MSPEHITSELLGIPTTNDSRLLLGITKGRTDRIAIQNALRRRLAQLHVHPMGHTEDANKVRSFLQRIASDLEKNAPQEPTLSNQNQLDLTPLDQAIIAALISEGGWNKNSRSRLVGIAASYSITVGGLMRILEAFAVAARTGAGPLSFKQRTTHSINRTWTSLPRKKPTLSTADQFISYAAKRFTPELSETSPVMTIKLAILFGLLTIIAFVLSLQVLLVKEKTSATSEPTIRSSFPLTSSSVTQRKQLKLFDSYPIFKVDGIEKSMLQYSDQGVEQPARLASIEKSLQASVSKGETPSQNLLKEWNESMDILSYGWPFINTQILQDSQAQIVHVLLQAEAYPSFAKQLLDSFQLPPITMGAPSQIARIVWNSGVLATLSYEHRLNVETRSVAKQFQYHSITTSDSNEAKSSALNIIANTLLEKTEFDNRSLEMWEAWFVVVNQLQKFSNNASQPIYLIKLILNSRVDLLRQSNTRKVLGRVINDTSWISSSFARDEICNILQSEESSDIDLAVLTALFKESDNTSWFTEKYLLSEESSLHERTLVSQQLMQDWPIDTSDLIAVWNLSIPIGLDDTLVEEWETEVEKSSLLPDDNILQFAKLRLLNEAAVSIWRGRPDLASRALEMARRFETNSSEHFTTPSTPQDDSFSSSFLRAGNDQYDQIDTIDSLYNSAATDLGSRDADLLASLALSNRRSKIRKAATKVITEQFKNGRNVALALVQHFDKAKTSEQIQSLVARLTNVILPEKESLLWNVAARKALVQHALTAGNKQLWEIDEISNEISTSLISEYLLLNPYSLPLSQEVQPLAAIDLVVESWKRILPPLYTQMHQLDFKPTGVLQKYLAKQLEYFSLLQAEESRWRSQKQTVNTTRVLIDSLQQQESILDQINAIELSIALHWQRLLNEVVSENNRRSTIK